MSSVPSITAFVATQACHGTEENVPKSHQNYKKTLPAETEKSWLSSMFNKFTLIGHDGILTAEIKQNSDMDGQAQRLSNQEHDITSRVRHLSEASSDGSSSPLPPLSPSNKDTMPSFPER